MTIGLGCWVSGEFAERVAPRAVFRDIPEAQCTAEGWTFRMMQHSVDTIKYFAVDFDDDGAVTTIYPRKNCPKR